MKNFYRLYFDPFYIKVDWSVKAADHKMKCQSIAKTYNRVHKQSKQAIVPLLTEHSITI